MIRWLTSALAAVLVLAPAGARAEIGDIAELPTPGGCIYFNANPSCQDGSNAIGTVGAMAVPLEGRQVYTASSGGRVGILDRDPATGTLTAKPGAQRCITRDGSGGACQLGRAQGTDVADIALSPDGRHVYAVHTGNDAITVYDREPAAGNLAQKAGASGCTTDTGRSDAADAATAGQCADGIALDAPSSIAISPDGGNVYVGTNASDAVAVFDRAADGTLTQKAGAGACIGNTIVVSCAPARGLNLVTDVAVAPDGKAVYSTSLNDDTLAVLQRAPDGTLSQPGGAEGCVDNTGAAGCAAGRGLTSPMAITISSDERSVYVAARSDFIAAFDRDPATGLVAQKAGTAGCLSDASPPEEGCAGALGLDGVDAITSSRDGRSVYFAGGASPPDASFTGYGVLRRSLADGSLSQPAAPNGCLSADGRSAFADPATAGNCIDGQFPAILYNQPQTVIVTPDDRHLLMGGNPMVAIASREAQTCAGRPLTLSGTPVKDVLIGTSGPDVIAGLDGNDALWGAEDDDVICGGDGDDAVAAGAGNDDADGGAGVDSINGESDDDRVRGSEGDDFLLGSGGNDTLEGGDGTDRALGDAGRDVLGGDAGADRLTGGLGKDAIRGGAGNDSLSGKGGKDVIRGEAGRDKLRGGPGADKLKGGPGKDRCSGNGGRDRGSGCEKPRSGVR